MPIALAIIGLAQSIYQERHGQPNSGLASFGNALNAIGSFSSLYNNYNSSANLMADAGVRRNFL